jgi:hypothetical protein
MATSLVLNQNRNQLNQKNQQQKKNKRIEEWEETDLSVMSLLIQTMEPKIGRLCMMLSSAKAIWDKTRNLYGQQ